MPLVLIHKKDGCTDVGTTVRSNYLTVMSYSAGLSMMSCLLP